MGNEETTGLVPVQEAETELVFAPQGESQLIGYGSRKIVRESLRNQLRNGYKCFDYTAIEIENEPKLKKVDSNTIAIVDVLINGVAYSKKELVAKTNLTEDKVVYALSVLRKHDFVEMIRVGRVFYYKILLNE